MSTTLMLFIALVVVLSAVIGYALGVQSERRIWRQRTVAGCASLTTQLTDEKERYDAQSRP